MLQSDVGEELGRWRGRLLRRDGEKISAKGRQLSGRQVLEGLDAESVLVTSSHSSYLAVS